METFYIAGSAEDPCYAQAELLGDLLRTNFPKVGLVKDMRHPCEWKEYRRTLLQKFGFNSPGSSVVIWRRDGRLIGSVVEFESVVKAKYNLELKLDPSFVVEVMKENLESSEKQTLEDSWTPYVGKYKKSWSDGIVFDGIWKQHKPHKGSVQFKEDLTYEGTLKEGLFNGQGVIRYADGAKFSGMFSNGKKEGLGKYTDMEGNVFEGTYRNDQLHGKGTRKWPSGRTYVGQWKNNRANGIGTETIPLESGKADEYIGAFSDDSRNGKGTMKYGNGNCYEGEWKGGARSGPGTFSWANAEDVVHFRGSFLNDLPADGQMVFSSGLTAALPGEIMQGEVGENWIEVLSSTAVDWFAQAKERKARTEAASSTFPIKDAEKNAMTRSLTEDKWNDLRTRLTQSGVGLHDCLLLEHHPVGLVAGDADCYTVFREVFDPVLAALHPTYTPTSTHPQNLDPSKLKTPAALGDIIQSCSVRVERCIAQFPFAVAIESEERRKVEELLTKALQSLEDLELAGGYYPLAGSDSVIDKPGGMQPHEQSLLEADGVLFGKSDCGDTRDWPDARGVFCANNKQTVVHVNAQEHCAITASCVGFGIPGLVLRVVKVLKGMEKTLKDAGCSFANSPKHGALLGNLAGIGSSMTVEVAAKFPRLARRRDVAHILERFGLSLRSEAGRPMSRMKTPGGTEVMRLSVTAGLGTSEVDALNGVMSGVEELVKLERSLTAGRRQLWLIDEFPRVLVLGPPGSRRRELAARVAAELGLPLVSVGELLRRSASDGFAEAKRALLDGGELPVSAMEGVRQRLGEEDCAKGWVLEGFGRSAEQVESLKGVEAPNKVVLLNAANPLLLPVLKQRRVDPATGTFYASPDAVPADDTDLVARLVQRACDVHPAASRRIEQHRAVASAVQGMFPRASRIFDADGDLDVVAGAAATFALETPPL